MQAAIDALDRKRPLTLESLMAEQAVLEKRIERFGTSRDALDVWRELGVAAPEALPLLDRDAFVEAASNARVEI